VSRPPRSAGNADRNPHTCTARQRPIEVTLHGLSPDEAYELTFNDTGETRGATGTELAQPLRITIDRAPGSALITYTKAADEQDAEKRVHSELFVSKGRRPAKGGYARQRVAWAVRPRFSTRKANA